MPPRACVSKAGNSTHLCDHRQAKNNVANSQFNLSLGQANNNRCSLDVPLILICRAITTPLPLHTSRKTWSRHSDPSCKFVQRQRTAAPCSASAVSSFAYSLPGLGNWRGWPPTDMDFVCGHSQLSLSSPLPEVPCTCPSSTGSLPPMPACLHRWAPPPQLFGPSHVGGCISFILPRGRAAWTRQRHGLLDGFQIMVNGGFRAA